MKTTANKVKFSLGERFKENVMLNDIAIRKYSTDKFINNWLTNENVYLKKIIKYLKRCK